jgi:hypothetical protein
MVAFSTFIVSALIAGWSPLNGFLIDFRAIGSLDGTGHTTTHYQSDDALSDLALDQRYSLW